MRIQTCSLFKMELEFKKLCYNNYPKMEYAPGL